MALFERISPNEMDQAFKVLVDDTTKVARWFRSFTNGYMPVALERITGKSFDSLQYEIVKMDDLPKSEDVHIPYFTDTSNLKRTET